MLEAADASGALRTLAGQERINLVFTDLALPDGQSGRQFAEAVEARRPGAKVLFTTGFARTAMLHHRAPDTDVALLVKPFTIEELAAAVRECWMRPTMCRFHERAR